MTDAFGSWLADKIAEIPCTRVEFAKRIGVSIHTLNTWIQRQGGVRADHITRIAKGLNMPREQVKEQIESAGRAAA